MKMQREQVRRKAALGTAPGYPWETFHPAALFDRFAGPGRGACQRQSKQNVCWTSNRSETCASFVEPLFNVFSLS